MLLVLTGPTAAGKTAAALTLAREFPIEIISADSRQVYRGMDIGTAKPSVGDRSRVPHHLVDVADPNDVFNAHRFVQTATHILGNITARGKIPIVVGGTGFYIKALLNQRLLARVPPDPDLRCDLARLQDREGIQALVARLQCSDPTRAYTIDQANPRRLVRAIEVAESQPTTDDPQQDPLTALIFAIDSAREVLAKNIARRAHEMYDRGLIEETRTLLERGVSLESEALTSVGYGEAAAALDGRLTIDEARDRTVVRTRQFARRQRTWFRHQLPVHWISPDEIVQTISAHLDTRLDTGAP